MEGKEVDWAVILGKKVWMLLKFFKYTEIISENEKTKALQYLCGTSTGKIL